MTQQKKGFIALQRSILEWEWYNDIPTKTLFIHILLKANFKDKNWQGHLVKRGELITGRKQLSQETGLSEQQTKTALKKLQSTNEITIKATNRFSIITLVNYGLYQDRKEDTNQQNNQQNNQQSTNNQPTDKQQATTTKNENNNNNDNNNKKTKAKKDFFDLDIPDYVNKETLKDYIDTRKNSRSPMSKPALKLLIKKIKDFKEQGQDINKCLEEAILSNWKSIFPLKESKQSKPPININIKEIDYGTSGKF